MVIKAMLRGLRTIEELKEFGGQYTEFNFLVGE
jgi:hypothetical protein